MKQEVSVTMAAKTFKILTLLISISFNSSISAKLILQEKMKKNLRWELKVPKKQVLLEGNQSYFSIKTLNFQLYRELVSDLKKMDLDESYFKKFY
ncbi:hypothetical protein OAK75_06750, partial [Bacteriovoracales bacterium]|nr:hypothetical protein [Bacteriovoracales bacterium]